MEVITIEVAAWKELCKKIDAIGSKLEEQGSIQHLPDKWLDNQDVCQLLHITPRTLQAYRDDKKIHFSKIGSKIYFKASDVQQLLESHYSKNI